MEYMLLRRVAHFDVLEDSFSQVAPKVCLRVGWILASEVS